MAESEGFDTLRPGTHRGQYFFVIIYLPCPLLRTITNLLNASMNDNQTSTGSGLRKMQRMVDLSSHPLPPMPVSSPMAATFFASQTDVTSEGPTPAEVLARSELVTQKVAIQATTAILANQLTDDALLSTMDVIDEDYDLFMEIATLLCSNPLKRSLLFKLVKKVVRQKERIFAHREELKSDRAALRKDLHAALPAEPIMKGVKVYTEKTGSAHPINGPLLRKLNAKSWPATMITPTQTNKIKKRPKKSNPLTPKASSGPGRSTPPARAFQTTGSASQNQKAAEDETELIIWEKKMGIRDWDADEQGEEDEMTDDDTDDIQEIVEDMDLSMD